MLTRITYGNDFSIKVPVVKAQYETSGQVWIDFDIVQCKDVRVSLICTKHQTVIPLEWRIEDGTNNVIIADIQGKWLHSGAIYGVEIVGLDTEDRAWRYYNNSVFSVINTTAGSYMNENLMEDPLIINAQVSLAVNTIMGPQGPQGTQGPTGEKGADGTMSFDDLTPEQKESLRGDQGPQGEKGDKGDTGAQGPTGPQGEKGADGTMSFEDLTPEQKESLRGDQGPAGPQGEKGETGPQGEKGDKGDTGAQGPAGPQGEKGLDGTMSFDDLTPEQKESLKGDQGPTGPQGDTGAQGAAGPQGDRGTDGAPGPQGSRGEQGSQGPAGTTDYDELENKPTFKTINGESILGEGDIEIEGGGDTVEPAKIIVTDEEVQDPDSDAVYIVQKPIELKTINGNEIVGTGDIEIEADTSDIEEQLTGIQTAVSGHQTAIENQATEISGMQTQISGHQTAIENQATEISGMQTQISGHQTAIENQATEISGMQSNISGIQTVVSGHQTAIENQATEISGMQTVLAGHQTALENQSGGGDPGFIKVTNGNKTGLVSSLSTHYDTNIGNYSIIFGDAYSTGSYAISASGNYSIAEGYGTKATGAFSHSEGNSTQAKGVSSHTFGEQTIANNNNEIASGSYNVSTKTNTTFGDAGNTLFSVGNGTGYNNRHNAFEIRQNGDIYLNDGTHPISSTTNGLKIEVVSALPASPDASTIYIVQ